MTFTQAITSGFKNYVNFSGRACRSEFWFWQLFIVLASIVAVILDSIIQTPNQVFASLFGLATVIPDLAVMVRRMHDTDFRGWWLLLGFVPLIGMIVLIVWWCLEGTRGYNRFGADPLPTEFSRHAAGRSLLRGRTDRGDDGAPRHAPM